MNKEVKTQPEANMQDNSAFANLPGEEELFEQDLDAVSGGFTTLVKKHVQAIMTNKR